MLAKKKCMQATQTADNLDSNTIEMLTKALKAGFECLRNGDLANAQSLYEKALQVDPRLDEAWHYLGVIEQQLGNLSRANEYLATAVKLSPGNFLCHFNRGVILQEMNDLDEAVNEYRFAVKLKPDYFQAHENLGVALQDLGKVREAAASFKKALKYNSNSILARRNLGTVLEAEGNWRESLAQFNQVLHNNPADPETRMKRAMLLLRCGEYENGWKEYEWRQHSPGFRDQNPARSYPFPKWDGSDPAGKTLLIHSEQGLGDEVMFASCLPDMIAAFGLCIVECDPRLQDIFQRSFPNAHIISRRSLSDLSWVNDLPAIDWRLPIAGLPRFFRKNPKDFPQKPFLSADSGRCSQWAERLNKDNGELKIGISWRGGRDARAKTYRSMALGEMAPILEIDAARFISLQYDGDAGEVDQLPERLRGKVEFMPDLDLFSDLENLLALMSNLDLVISVDNSTVHFAGALGVPTWALLPALPDWRWQEKGEGSDWYPSVHLWRRSFSNEDWEPTARRVAEALMNVGVLSHCQGMDACEIDLDSVKKSKIMVQEAGERAGNSSDPSCLLLNDTSAWYHWGCSCTSIALHEGIRGRGFSLQALPHYLSSRLSGLPSTLEEFRDRPRFLTWLERQPHLIEPLQRVESVVINGEGTLHGLSDSAVGLLYLAYHAKQTLGKHVQIVNHSCYPDGTADLSSSPALELYKEVYSGLDFIGIRETISAELLEQMGVRVESTFDCLPLFLRQFFQTAPEKDDHVILAGSVAWQPSQIPAFAKWIESCRKKGLKVKVLVGAEAFLAGDDVSFVSSLAAVLPQPAWELTMATSESEWLQHIASARLLVSGRFHHSLAAAWLKTPFLLFGSNTPKIPGLMKMLGLNNSFIPFSNEWGKDLARKTKCSLANPGENLADRQKLQDLEKLSEKNFSGLENYRIKKITKETQK